MIDLDVCWYCIGFHLGFHSHSISIYIDREIDGDVKDVYQYLGIDIDGKDICLAGYWCRCRERQKDRRRKVCPDWI